MLNCWTNIGLASIIVSRKRFLLIRDFDFLLCRSFLQAGLSEGMRPMPYFPFDKDLKKEGARAIEVSSLETKKAPAVIPRTAILFTF